MNKSVQLRQCVGILIAPLLVGLGCANAVGEPMEEETSYVEQALTAVTFSPNPGNLRMFTHVPAGMPSGAAPLVVALHGCTQQAQGFATESGWLDLADYLKFYLVFPEQQSGNNPAYCFNWAGEYGATANMIRGQGENMSIKAMVDKMQADHPGAIDPDRVYVVGFSAGAYMATVMLATYPDVFAGGAVLEGGPYHCADNVNPAFQCMSDGKLHNNGSTSSPTPDGWADLVRQHAGFDSYWSNPPRVPIVMSWQGDADTTVAPPNQPSVIAQWTALHGTDNQPDTSGSIGGYDVHDYLAGTRVVARSVRVPPLRHAVAIDPGPGPEQGGTVGGYSQDVGVFAAYHIATFFGLDGLGPADTLPPVVNIAAPAHGSTVSGVVAIQVSATDNVGVTRVECFVDNDKIGETLAPPYQCAWNSAAGAPGVHNLKAVAYDAAGNEGIDDDTQVDVQSSGTDQEPPSVNITAPLHGDQVSGMVSVEATASDNQGVASVTFLAGSAVLCTDDTTPYVCAWDTSSLAPGSSHNLRAIAADFAGNSAEDNDTTVSVGADEQAPTVDITHPVEAYGVPSTQGGLIKLRGSAWDDAGLEHVELRVYEFSFGYTGSTTLKATKQALVTLPDADGTVEWIYALDAASLTAFKYYLVEAVAFDNAGNASDAASVRILINPYLGTSTFTWPPSSLLP